MMENEESRRVARLVNQLAVNATSVLSQDSQLHFIIKEMPNFAHYVSQDTVVTEWRGVTNTS